MSITPKEYRIVYVTFDQIEDSPFQPESRFKLDKRWFDLVNSIKMKGLQYPPLALQLSDNKYQIVEGHRRKRICQQLGLPKMPLILTDGDPSELFSHVSTNVNKISPQQWIEVHLKGGFVGPASIRSCINKLEACVGKDYLQDLVNADISPSIWNLCNRVMRFVELHEKDRSKVLYWLFCIGTKGISTWISNQFGKEEMKLALLENRYPNANNVNKMIAR